MTTRERFAAMAMQAIVSNPKLHDDFWEDYESYAKSIGAQEAANAIEGRIAYRAYRIADAMMKQTRRVGEK